MDDSELPIMKDPAVADAFELLTEKLSGSDLRLFLRRVAATRAGSIDPGGVLRQQQTDRFCETSDIDAAALARASADALERAEEAGFDPLQLSPLAPLGACSTFGSVAQANVVTTMQLCEIVSDPTSALALAAAARRRLLRDSPETTRLSAVQRVVRAKQFDAPGALAHFSMFGLVSVGSDRGGRRFEVEELTNQLRMLVDVITTVQPSGQIIIEVSDNSGRRNEAEALVDSLADGAETKVGRPRPDISGHYPNLFAKLSWSGRGTTVELGYGGVASWPSEFTAARKEQVVVAGLDIDRLVEVSSPRRMH